VPVLVLCRWSNPRTEGKLMSFDLVDADGSEIRVTAWNDQVDQFQDMVQVREEARRSRGLPGSCQTVN